MTHGLEQGVTLNDEVHLLKGILSISQNVKGKCSFMWQLTMCTYGEVYILMIYGDLHYFTGDYYTGAYFLFLTKSLIFFVHFLCICCSYLLTGKHVVFLCFFSCKTYSTWDCQALENEPLNCSIHRCLPRSPWGWQQRFHNKTVRYIFIVPGFM